MDRANIDLRAVLLVLFFEKLKETSDLLADFMWIYALLGGNPVDEGERLAYAQQRWYDPETAQFTSEDPIKDNLNWYAYCGNNPMGMVDVLGLEDNYFWNTSYSSATDYFGYDSFSNFTPLSFNISQYDSPFKFTQVPDLGDGFFSSVGEYGLGLGASIYNLGLTGIDVPIGILGAAKGASDWIYNKTGFDIPEEMRQDFMTGGAGFADSFSMNSLHYFMTNVDSIAKFSSSKAGQIISTVGNKIDNVVKFFDDKIDNISNYFSKNSAKRTGEVVDDTIKVAHYTDLDSANKIVNSGILKSSSDTNYVEVMKFNAKTKDVLNCGAKNFDYKVVFDVPKNLLEPNNFVNVPNSLRYPLEGPVNITNYNPVIMPGIKK